MQFVLAVDLKSHNQNVIEAQTSSLKSRLKGFVFCFLTKQKIWHNRLEITAIFMHSLAFSEV